ncbi:unnamed protein product [Acanthoscelides obtectus]|uniref:2',5'-phosphodiesterase 12 n=1 Tax=Acanthoscelides obtectus TaxID=200917 RepID=A0A9P0LHN6_ACAOB|nr:unnamed protein product [Acanthoscelides obtectus]CAK1624837.1 2',5'-phosphodiesterase 12 [Acanthoscelides obtectus]
MVPFRFRNLLLNFNISRHMVIENTRYIHKYIFKMDKAYLRHLDDETFDFTFKYVNEELKVNRQFNLSRKSSETVEAFLQRVSANLEKVISKKNKKKKDTDTSTPHLNISLTVNNDDVDKSMFCYEIFRERSQISLRINETTYHVIVNSPWIYALALPACMMADFPVYPSKYDTTYTDKDKSQFLWSKSKNKQTWVHAGEGYIFHPTTEDIGHYLKLSCLPRNDRLEGPVAEAISSCVVEAGPGECPFERRHAFTKSRVEEKEFRVVTYNILADLYCDSDYTRQVLFPYCPPFALSIDYRKELILKEIIGYNADMIALQEVDRKVFKYDLEPTLSQLGYDGTLTTKGEEVAEGLAFFTFKKRFNLLRSAKIVFAEQLPKNPLYSSIWCEVQKNEQLMTRVLNRSTTMQVNLVISVEHDEMILVGNIHMYFHPDADHIRLLHGGMAILYLEDLVKKLRKENTDKRVSLILCGDFNSTPDCGIYKLYTTGDVSKDCIDYQSRTTDDMALRAGRSQYHSEMGLPRRIFIVDSITSEKWIRWGFLKRWISKNELSPYPSTEPYNKN